MDCPILPGFDLKFATQLARRAGLVHRHHFRSLGVPFDKKEDLTPVTKADLEVQELVSGAMARDFPSVSIVGEEGSRLVAGSPWRLIVDELDGTLSYRCGIPIATFMLALCFEGHPVLAAIFDPHADLMYTAELDCGAFVREQPVRRHQLKVSQATSLAGQVIAVETSPRSKLGLQRLNTEVQLRGGAATNFYSFGYQAMRMAMGQFAGFIFPGRRLHDCCAPYLIVKEAGAVITDMDGGVPQFDGGATNGLVAAATPELHSQLMEIVSLCRE